MSKDKKLTAEDKMGMVFKIISGSPADEVAKEYEVDVEMANSYVDILKKFPNILFDNHFMKLILLSFQYIQLEVINSQILETKRGLFCYRIC